MHDNLPNDPFSYSSITYAWVIGLSVWGGIANYARKISNGTISRLSVVEFIGDLFISGFTGIVTFYLCEFSGFDWRLSAAFVGISGHMGSRAVFGFEKFLQRKIRDIPND